jgi:primosomal protein N'
MNIITVYPIIRGAFKDELTYWSSHAFNIGTIIEVPLRGRTIPALVGTVTPASHAKANIKQASFVTRKIERTKELHIVKPECIRACIKMSETYAVPLGNVLKSCIPDAILQDSLSGNSNKKNEKLEKTDSGRKEVDTHNGAHDGIHDANHHANKDAAKAMITDHGAIGTAKYADTNHGIASDILVFQTNTEDRMGTYRSIAREEFARKRSVLIVTPTVMSAEELHKNLQKGIENYVIVLHGSLSKKKQIDLWKKALETEHPILVISTPLFASVPRPDIQTIILERESSRAYSAIRTPYIDFRDYIETYAKMQSSRLIYGDTLLRVETLHRREVGEVADFFPISYRVEKDAELIIVDMSSGNADKKDEKSGAEQSGHAAPKNAGMGNGGAGNAGTGNTDTSPTRETREKREERLSQKKKGFQIFSEELQLMIEYTGKKSLPMFIFTARRGLSPQTVCGDCGHTVECQVCNAPIVLHQKKSAPISSGTMNGTTHGVTSGASGSNPTGAGNEYSLDINPNRFFLCHHCGTERSAVEACVACGSWKLITLGIGIETVADEIRKQFPKRQVFRLDKDVVKTDKQAQTVIAEFKNSADGILLGTESSLAFIPQVEYSAIASLDSLFSIPDFKINERITHTILRILEKTSKYVLIQTRNPKNSVLKHIASGNLLSLYREELSMRKMLNYPPFITHIKVTIEDTRSGAAMKMKSLQQLLEECERRSAAKFEMLVFPAFVPGAKGKSTLHLLLSIAKKDWPDEHLRALLQSLPHEYAVRVNPESLL